MEATIFSIVVEGGSNHFPSPISDSIIVVRDEKYFFSSYTDAVTPLTLQFRHLHCRYAT